MAGIMVIRLALHCSAPIGDTGKLCRTRLCKVHFGGGMGVIDIVCPTCKTHSEFRSGPFGIEVIQNGDSVRTSKAESS